MKIFDVAIIGAGPAGAASAIFLARRGYSVALLDKAVFPRAKLCGDFLNPACWGLFDRLGIRAALASLEHQRIGRFRLSTPSAEAAVPFPSPDGRPVFGFGLRRSLFDDLLLRLAIQEGVAVEQGARLSGLERAGADWRLARDSAPGETLRARLLIGADGRNSWVAHRLGVAAPGEESGKYVAFQLSLADCDGPGEDIQIHLFPGGYAGLAGVGGRSANLCFAIERRIVRESPSFEAVLERHLARNSRLKKALDHSPIDGEVRSTYPVYFSPRRSFGDGFLLAGDAARVTEPVTGEGVYFALKSGQLAAEAADAAFRRGDLSARQLSAYAAACRGALARRQGVNRLIRAMVLRSYLLTPLIRLAAKNNFPINALVGLVCRTDP